MRERPNRSHEAGTSTRPPPSSVSAVVLTHRRPRLATAVVRSLVEREGLSADRVVVVVNGSGGSRTPLWSPACDLSGCHATSGRQVASLPE